MPRIKIEESQKKIPTIKNGYQIINGFAVETEEHKKMRLDRVTKARMTKSNIPLFALDYNIDKDYLGENSKVVPKLKRIAEIVETKEKLKLNQDEEAIDLYSLVRGYLYYFYGTNGTQKTYTSAWLAKRLMDLGESVLFTTMQDVLKDLTDLENNKDPKSDTYKRIAEYYDCQFLFLDESFDKSKVTMYKSNFQIPFLDDLIRKRIQYGKAIIFISNVSPTEIKEFAGDSISDFVNRSLEISKANFQFKDVYLKNLDKYEGQSIINIFDEEDDD